VKGADEPCGGLVVRGSATAAKGGRSPAKARRVPDGRSNKIYTRTRRCGLTSLGSGERVPKQSARIAAYGTVDEPTARRRGPISVRETHPASA